MATLHVPPYPTAETVIDSDEEADNANEGVTVGNHKPNKGGVDTWVNKPSSRKNSTNKKEEKLKSSAGSLKEKSKKWSFGMPPLTTYGRPQHGKSRTLSMSDVRRHSGMLHFTFMISHYLYRTIRKCVACLPLIAQHLAATWSWPVHTI
jgi:hypothetical protein